MKKIHFSKTVILKFLFAFQISYFATDEFAYNLQQDCKYAFNLQAAKNLKG